MSKTVIIFIVGVLLALLTVGGYLASQTYFARADPSLEPQNVVIERQSPTTGQVTFTTVKPAIASIECSDTADGTFEICGAEETATTDHQVKTSVILDPESPYYFYITIGNTRYDNLGQPLAFERVQEDKPSASEFPVQLLGTCNDDLTYVAEYDVNKDGCIRFNDRDLYGQ